MHCEMPIPYSIQNTRIFHLEVTMLGDFTKLYTHLFSFQQKKKSLQLSTRFSRFSQGKPDHKIHYNAPGKLPHIDIWLPAAI